MIVDGQKMYELYVEKGLPLSDGLKLGLSHGFRCDVPELIKILRLHGWSLEKVQGFLRAAYSEGCGYKNGSLNLVDELTKVAYLDFS